MRVVVFDDVLFGQQEDYAGLGLELRFFEHADDAVRVVLQEQPDLVLMDYSMTGRLTGDEAIEQLRARFPRGELAVVGISSDVASNDRMVAFGADDAVPKSHLRAYLHTKLRRGTLPEPAAARAGAKAR